MKILIASDSFKDGLPSLEVCKAIAEGIRMADEKIETILFPMADGGEGTSEILTYHNGGHTIELLVQDPLLRKVKASYGLSSDGQTAFIEMAQASGLQLLKNEERNPLITSTFGTGELIADALQRGAKKIILGIGGSATNDAGMGMAMALGYRFLDHHDNELQPFGNSLNKVFAIDDAAVNILLDGVAIEVVCDVDNPLFGANGAAHIYARQKGADDYVIALLDEGLQNFAKVIKRELQINVSQMPGAGAAGGLGAGAVAFLNARLRSGIELVMELTQFEKQLTDVDLIITGEGKLDGQTLHGKLIHGICRKAQQKKIPVIALCGVLEANPREIHTIGLHAAFSINKRVDDLAKAIINTRTNLIKTSRYLLENWPDI